MEPRSTAVLLIACPDSKGLVAGVSDFVFRRGGNIIGADQHVDSGEGLFFMRMEWELDGSASRRSSMPWRSRPPLNYPVGPVTGLRRGLRTGR